MKNRISQVAIMLLVSGALAFAGDKDKSAAASDNAQPSSAIQYDGTVPNNSPCVSTSDEKKNKNDKNKDKAAPSDQEEQFNKVLQGIYG